jgi:hypothetical protein
MIFPALGRRRVCGRGHPGVAADSDSVPVSSHRKWLSDIKQKAKEKFKDTFS